MAHGLGARCAPQCSLVQFWRTLSAHALAAPRTRRACCSCGQASRLRFAFVLSEGKDAGVDATVTQHVVVVFRKKSRHSLCVLHRCHSFLESEVTINLSVNLEEKKELISTNNALGSS